MSRMSSEDPAPGTDSAVDTHARPDEPLLVDRNPLPDAIAGDLRRQLTFIVEVDRMKAVLRQSVTAAVRRRENDAEHSWHLALMAIVLAERSAVPVDRARVVELVVLHDLVEVYAGDTPLHDDVDLDEQAARESAAADRLYALLPTEQGARLRAAWEEFEAHETPEARFARAMDRLQPLLLSWVTRGEALDDTATPTGVRERLRVIADGSPELWEAAETLIDESERRGWLAG
jgi:putative hydrolases of HD superfamily